MVAEETAHLLVETLEEIGIVATMVIGVTGKSLAVPGLTVTDREADIMEEITVDTIQSQTLGSDVTTIITIGKEENADLSTETDLAN